MKAGTGLQLGWRLGEETGSHPAGGHRFATVRSSDAQGGLQTNAPETAVDTRRRGALRRVELADGHARGGGPSFAGESRGIGYLLPVLCWGSELSLQLHACPVRSTRDGQTQLGIEPFQQLCREPKSGKRSNPECARESARGRRRLGPVFVADPATASGRKPCPYTRGCGGSGVAESVLRSRLTRRVCRCDGVRNNL